MFVITSIGWIRLLDMDKAINLGYYRNAMDQNLHPIYPKSDIIDGISIENRYIRIFYIVMYITNLGFICVL